MATAGRSKRGFLLLIMGGLILVIGQAWASAIHWLRLPSDTFDSVRATTCSVLPFCDSVRYPFYFLLIFPLLLLALILLALALHQTARRVTHDVDWATLDAPMAIRRWWIATAVVALVMSGLGVVSALSADNQYPSPLIWFVALLLWGVTFYGFDRAHRRRLPLARRDVIHLLAYLLLLGVLGFVYRLPILQMALARGIFVLAAGLILLALWRRKRISGVAAVFALVAIGGLALYTYDLMSWRYSYIPDDFPFYQRAASYLNNPTLPNPLASRGVYNLNPVFANYIHAVGLALYGNDFYGWRFIDIVLIFLTAPAIYGLVRWLKGTGAGLLAVIVFISSHPVLALAHVGYNNVQILPGFAAMLVFGLIGLERRSALAMFLAAVGAAATFYTYAIGFPLIPLPLLLLAIWICWPTRKVAFKRRLMSGLLLGGVFVIGLWATAFPRVLNTLWIGDTAFKSVFRSEVHGLTSPLLEQILPNTVYTLGASIYFDSRSHYTSGAHLDPISSALMLVGVAGLIAARRRTALWLLLSFMATVFVVGGLVPYPYPSNTRTFLLAIFYAVFAALGAGYLWETVGDLGASVSPTMLRVGFACATIGIVALNAYQFFYLSTLDVPETPVAMMIDQLNETPPKTTLYYVALSSDDSPVMLVAAASGFDASRFKPITESVPLVALTEVRQTAAAPYRVLIVPDMANSQQWFAAAQQVWPDHPLEKVADDSGMTQFQMIDVPG